MSTPLEPDSRARDHLANERTYLAWQRTAIGVMVLGVAIAKFVDHTSARSVVAGALLVAVGAVGQLYGGFRYRRTSRDIERGEWVTHLHGPIWGGVILFVAIVAAFVLVVT